MIRPQTPLPKNVIAAHLRKLGLYANANSNNRSSQINLTKTPEGTTFAVASQHHPVGLEMVEGYNPSSSYGPQDMVVIAQEMTVGTYRIPAGTFVCKSPVPMHYTDDEVSEMASSIFSASYAQSIRNVDINYLPATASSAVWEIVGTPSSGSSTTIQEFQVVSVTGDYLICNAITRGTTGSITSTITGSYIVAKPYDLRFSTWSGSTGDATYTGETKTYKSGSTTIYSETLKPSYAGAYILATPNVTIFNGSGSYASGSGASGSAIAYTDLNIDARKYMPMIQSMSVCITENGITTQKKFMYFGGAPYA